MINFKEPPVCLRLHSRTCKNRFIYFVKTKEMKLYQTFIAIEYSRFLITIEETLHSYLFNSSFMAF